MANRCNRRKFIRNAALGGMGWTILKDSRSVWGAPANDKLSLAIIGCGGRGRAFAMRGNVYGAQGSSSIVSVNFLCDVNEKKAAEAFADFPEAKKFNDYREMFEKHQKEIDVVIVATGDYSHAPASAAAMRAGKPVYCEKPLTVSVKESRMLANMAAELKIPTQMGNNHGYSRKAVNMVWSGMLGEVHEAHGWCTSAGSGNVPLPSGRHEIPDTLKWDLWLGPAPYRDYNPAWLTYMTWREFSTENMGNRGSHSMASVFKALKIDELWKKTGAGAHPVIRVTCLECSELCVHSYPRWYRTVWQVPAREGMPPVKVYWYGGNLETERSKLENILGRKLQLGGPGEAFQDWVNSLIVGQKGTLYCSGNAILQEIVPKEKFEGMEPPNLLPPNIGKSFVDGWYDAIRKGGTDPMCSFDGFSGPYTEFLCMAPVSTLFPGEELEFDPIDCRILNNEKADRALRHEYRPGWGMEAAG